MMSSRRIQSAWQIARCPALENPAAVPNIPDGEWLPATVPGAVQLDWAAANKLPPYQVGDNIRAWRGLEDSHWLYRARLNPPDTPPPSPGQRLFLVLEGVDYAFRVFHSGQLMHRQEGAQTPARIDVTAHAADLREGAPVYVLIDPAPKSRPAPADRAQADHSCKPAVAYGWDFHPRLIPLGFWRDAYFELCGAARFRVAPEIHYTLAGDFSRATGTLAVHLAGPAPDELALGWRLLGIDGGEVFSAGAAIPKNAVECAIPFSLALDDGALWWPHDQGRPALHTAEVELSWHGALVDRARFKVGFRRIRLVMAPGQWERPADFPKSRSRPPITLEVNGRPLFAKGSNWVCPDIFPGTLTPERYAAQLRLARDANLNLLRVWGGAGAPHDWFYEQCDELGLMVWQEFPLACNCYPDAPDYLDVLDQESRSLIRRLRPHPSLVLWCGGNELFNVWSGMTDQSLPLRLLNRNCYDLDPARPFLPASPVSGMGHGHYVFRDSRTGEEAWAVFQKSDCTAYSEFGCPGPASERVLREIIPATELWPPRPGTAWETHHAFGAWDVDPSTHIHLPTLEHYFGPCENFAALVARGQLLQAAGFQGMFEEVRRQKPAASMALNWCFNEPWPCAANNSLVAWPCEPKPALAAVAQACRPTLASARIRKFSWAPGELFDPELWLLHDGPRELPPVTLTLWLELDGRRQPAPLLIWPAGASPVPPNTNRRGPRAQLPLPDFAGPCFLLLAEVENHPEWNSAYTLVKTRGTTALATPETAHRSRPMNG
jgi:beta-mannosidase